MNSKTQIENGAVPGFQYKKILILTVKKCGYNNFIYFYKKTILNVKFMMMKLSINRIYP